MSKIIVVTSGKGGVGKTTSAINLAASLNKKGKNVVIVDGNLTTPNIGLHLGAPIVPISLYDVLAERNNIREAMYEHHSGLKIVPASLSLDDMTNSNYENLAYHLKQLKKFSDFVICDSAAGLGYEALSALEAADEVIIITQPELPAVADALKTIRIAESMGKKVSGVIVTKVKNAKSEMSIRSIEAMLDYSVIGIIPDDSAIQSALAERDAVVNLFPGCKASKSYEKIAAMIAGEPAKQGFFSKLMGFFGFR